MVGHLWSLELVGWLWSPMTRLEPSSRHWGGRAWSADSSPVGVGH